MENAQELSRIFRRTLQIRNSPVAVRLIRVEEETPVLMKKPSSPLHSFCFAVMEGFKGRSFFLTREDVRCRMGLITLGLIKETPKRGGQATKGQIGLFGKEEAFRNYLARKISLPPAYLQGVALSPLEKSIMGVDVLLFRVNPEQAMWLLNAHQYLTGDRIDLSIGTGFQGVCGDVIAYPYLHQKLNLTVNGVGDRLTTSMGKNELFIGVPGALVQTIASNLIEMHRKPVFQALRSSRSLNRNSGHRTSPRR